MNQDNNPESKDVKTVYMAPAEWYHPIQEEDEIDLLSLLATLLKRKKIIAGFTIFAAVISAVYAAFIITPKYKVSALVAPGIIGFQEDGSPIHASTLTDIQQWLGSGGYIDDMLLKLPPDAMVRGMIPGPGSLDTSMPRNGQIMTVNLYTPEPEKGRQILKTILDILANSQNSYVYAKENLGKQLLDLNEQLENWDIGQTRHLSAVEKAEKQIAIMKNDMELLKHSHELAIGKGEREIALMGKDLERLEKEIQAMSKTAERLDLQIQEINANTLKIRMQRDRITETEDENNLAMLMYSNIIQQNMDSAIRLEQLLNQLESNILEQMQQYSAKQVEIKNRKSDLENIKEKQALDRLKAKKNLENSELDLEDLKKSQTRELELSKNEIKRQITVLDSQMALLKPLTIVQNPMSSPGPVKPDKKKIIALATIMGIFFGIMAAFMVEYYVRNKDRLRDY